MVAGLLFLALAYLAVGQAAVNRGGAQTAADAAALAAAQDARDQLAGMWVAAVRDPTKWQAIFDGAGAGDFCWRADQLAVQNYAEVRSCNPDLLAYSVEVRTDKRVGDSVVPGIEGVQSTARARAVIEPLCKPPAEGLADHPLPQLSCRDKVWDLEPDDPSALPTPSDLFDVHLAD